MFGQIVQGVKPNVSKDFGRPVRHPFGMTDRPRERDFKEAFIARVKVLREGKGWSAAQMATALGIPAERYQKYERRSVLPAYLIEPFALIVGRDVEFLLTGKNPRAVRAAEPPAATASQPVDFHRALRDRTATPKSAAPKSKDARRERKED